jgi:hypothetical protein
VLWSASVCRAETERFRVEYRADDDCPDIDEFTRQVLARTTLARLSDDNQPAHAFRVAIVRTPGGTNGNLSIREPDGTASTRHVEAATCDEVVGALALIAALTLDPSASTTPLPKRPPASPAPTASSAVQEPPPRTPQPAMLPPVAKSEPESASEGSSRWAGTSGAQFIAAGGIAPGTALGLATFVGIRRAVNERDRWEARLGFRWTPTVTADAELGQATFRWLAIRAEGCPVALSLTAWLVSEPCLAVDVGQLRAQGVRDETIQITGVDYAPWVSAGAVGRLHADVFGDLGVELEGGLLVPLYRHEFVFRHPDGTVYHTPPITGGLALGLALHFP